jgi:hypothetical protein
MVIINQIIGNDLSIFFIKVLADDVFVMREGIGYDILLKVDAIECHFEKEDVL